MCFAPQRRALFRHLDVKKWSEHVVFLPFWLGNVLCAITACAFSTAGRQKVVRGWCVLCILTWKCALRHNGVHFFDGWTSKSGPRLVCFVHFDLEMCFVPQRRALFRHLNFQKWSETVGFLTLLTWKCASRHNELVRTWGVFSFFYLQINVLGATTACIFSSLIWPAGSAPAALARLLFDLRSPKPLEKRSESRLPYLFAHLHLLSSDFLISISYLLTSWLLLADSSHLCFSISAYARNFDF